MSLFSRLRFRRRVAELLSPTPWPGRKRNYLVTQLKKRGRRSAVWAWAWSHQEAYNDRVGDLAQGNVHWVKEIESGETMIFIRAECL